MKIKLYRDAWSESYNFCVGHIDTETGMIYRDPVCQNYNLCVGHIRGGIVYSDAYSESSAHRVGQYTADGKIYRDPYSRSAAFCIGHINAKGIIFSDPYSESSYCAMGHVENNMFFPAAAASFLLLLPR